MCFFIGVLVCRSLVPVTVWVWSAYQNDMFGWCNTYDTDHFSNVFVDGVRKFWAACYILTVETYVLAAVDH